MYTFVIIPLVSRSRSKSRSSSKYQITGVNGKKHVSTTSYDSTTNSPPPVNQASRDSLPAMQPSNDTQCFDNAMYSDLETQLTQREEKAILSCDYNDVPYDTLPRRENTYVRENGELAEVTNSQGPMDENPYELTSE